MLDIATSPNLDLHPLLTYRVGMWKVYLRSHPRFGTWYTRVERQPGWVTRLALLAAVLVVVVPAVLLTLTALVVGLAVFIVLGVLAGIVRLVRGVLTGQAGPSVPETQNGGRVNVRVIQREP